MRLWGNKDQSGLSYHLHYREICAPACTEHNFWLFVKASLLRLTGWFHINFFFIYLSYREDLASLATSSQCYITRSQRPIRAFVLFTLQRKLCTNMHRTQILGYSLQPGCSGRSAVHHLVIKHLNLCKFNEKMARKYSEIRSKKGDSYTHCFTCKKINIKLKIYDYCIPPNQCAYR